ncbi:MAG: sn-glycerol-3-phosphate ABC transporter permease UgpE [Pseudomonadota bacterium]
MLLFFLPVWFVFAASTQEAAALSRGELSLLPRMAGLGIYYEVLSGTGEGAQGAVWPMLGVSFAMALAIAGGKLVVSVLAAYAVAFFRFPLRLVCFWVIFLTLMLPVEVRIMPTFELVADFGLINSFGGLVLPLVASATATLLYRQTFLLLPDELVEAARMDGAGPLRFLRDMALPLSSTNTAALFVILFVYGWNQYLWPLIAVTDSDLQTVMVGIVRMIGSEGQTYWNRVMATAMLALVPPVLVVLAMQRWFVKGLAEGST